MGNSNGVYNNAQSLNVNKHEHTHTFTDYRIFNGSFSMQNVLIKIRRNAGQYAMWSAEY